MFLNVYYNFKQKYKTSSIIRRTKNLIKLITDPNVQNYEKKADDIRLLKQGVEELERACKFQTRRVLWFLRERDGDMKLLNDLENNLSRMEKNFKETGQIGE